MSANFKQPAAPLPRGRHKLSAKSVRASQQRRLAAAMLELVAARGYARTTVPEVVALARVSRNAFYEFFADKEACFLAACETEAGSLAAGMLGAAGSGGWLERLLLGFDYYLAWWMERPEFARAYFVEMPAAGERAVRQRELAYQEFGAILANLGVLARKEQPELAPLPPLVPRLLVMSVTELIGAEMRHGRGSQLGALRAELMFYLVKLLADDRTAGRALKLL
jgi:AcrR family transcriptional regulator